jgi:hypothetical protein
VIGKATAGSAAIGAASAVSSFYFYIPWSRVFNGPQGATAATVAIGAAPVVSL